MKRRDFIKALATVAAYAVLPSASHAKQYPNDVYLPAGTEIREVGTDDLICTVKEDLIKGAVMLPDSLTWNWPKPKIGSAVSPEFNRAISKAHALFVDQQDALRLTNS
jgi:hypothetical protein